MLPFSSQTLDRMREVQEAHMQDICNVLAYSPSASDEYGIPLDEYDVGPAISCGLRLYSPKEIQQSGEVPVIMGELRLPINTELDTRSLVRITHRYGEELVEPMLFGVEGPARRGPSGLVVFLRTIDEDAAGVNNELITG